MKNLKITDKIISADVSSPLNIDFSYDTLKHTHRNEVIFLYSILRTLFFNFLEFKEQGAIDNISYFKVIQVIVLQVIQVIKVIKVIQVIQVIKVIKVI
jgi:hypothetical protein